MSQSPPAKMTTEGCTPRNPLSVYHVSVKRVLSSVAAWLATGAVGIGFIVLPFVPVYGSFSDYGSLMRTLFALTYLPIGMLMVFCSCLVTTGRVLSCFLKVEVYRSGFAWRTARGWLRYRWDDVAVVWNRNDHERYGGHSSNRFVEYELLLNDGRRVTFDRLLPDIRRLGAIIEEQTYPFLLANAVAAYRAGDWIDFRSIQISRQGSRWVDVLGRIGAMVLWEKITSLCSCRNGQHASSGGVRPICWTGQSPTKVSNLHVLIGLLAETGVTSEAQTHIASD
jgi:hypothetical protein